MRRPSRSQRAKEIQDPVAFDRMIEKKIGSAAYKHAPPVSMRHGLGNHAEHRLVI
jgi:hypothetical protein